MLIGGQKFRWWRSSWQGYRGEEVRWGGGGKFRKSCDGEAWRKEFEGGDQRREFGKEWAAAVAGVGEGGRGVGGGGSLAEGDSDGIEIGEGGIGNGFGEEA